MVGRLPACVLNMVQSSQVHWQRGLLRQAAACHSRGVWGSGSPRHTHVHAVPLRGGTAARVLPCLCTGCRAGTLTQCPTVTLPLQAGRSEALIAACTGTAVLLFDQRRLEAPLLSWKHGLQPNPPHLMQLFASRPQGTHSLLRCARSPSSATCNSMRGDAIAELQGCRLSATWWSSASHAPDSKLDCRCTSAGCGPCSGQFAKRLVSNTGVRCSKVMLHDSRHSKPGQSKPDCTCSDRSWTWLQDSMQATPGEGVFGTSHALAGTQASQAGAEPGLPGHKVSSFATRLWAFAAQAELS